MKKLEIAGIELKTPYIQAPLAGYTSYACRKLAYRYGCSLAYTEMISSQALVYESKRTKEMLPKHKEEGLVALQLFGGDKDVVLKSIEIVEKEAYYDFLDFNIGCPVPKVFKQGAGSAWLGREDELIDLVTEMCKVSTKPVIVKVRLGLDKDHMNYLELCKRLEKAGVKAIAVHGRTRKELFSGKVHYDAIREIREALTIPVIANGDISLENIDEVREETGCDLFMIGREAIGNPTIFRNLVLKDEGKEVVTTRNKDEQRELILEHLRELIKEVGDEKKASELMRGIACFYLKGLTDAKKIKIGLVKASSYKEYETILKDLKEGD